MFNEELSITRIAEKRGLVDSTIQKHLCFFVENGNLDVHRLLSPEKIMDIDSALAQSANTSLKRVRQGMLLF